MKKYTEHHEWVDLQNGLATVGITKKAQEELGDIVFVELPHVNRSYHKGELIAVLESTKAAIDLYIPISGKVVSINEELKQTPEMINQDPEGKGWIYRLELHQEEDMKLLLDESSYQKKFQ